MYDQTAIAMIKTLAEHSIFSPSALDGRDAQKKIRLIHWLMSKFKRERTERQPKLPSQPIPDHVESQTA